MALYIPRFLWQMAGFLKPGPSNNGQALVWNDSAQQIVASGLPVPAPSTTVAPLMDNSAAVGVSLLFSRQDHVHPSDTGRSPLAGPGSAQAFTVGALTVTTVNGTTISGSSTTAMLGNGSTTATTLKGVVTVGNLTLGAATTVANVFNSSVAGRLLLTGSIDGTVTSLGGSVVLREATSGTNPKGIDLWTNGIQQATINAAGTLMLGGQTVDNGGGAKVQITGNLSLTGDVQGGGASTTTTAVGFPWNSANGGNMLFGGTGTGAPGLICFYTAGQVERIRLQSNGNLCIAGTADNGTGARLQITGALTATTTGTFTTGMAVATTPFAWITARPSIDIGPSGAITADAASSTISIANNLYNGVGSWTYKTTMSGGIAQIANDGSFRLFTVVSGTAGTAAALVLQATHSANGNLLLGTSADTIYIGAGRALNLVAPTGTARIAVAGATTADSASIDIGCGAQRSGVIQGNADGSLAFHSNATLGTSAAVERMRIVALSGNVLIGATIDNTFAKLQVTGNLTVTGYLGETLGGVVASAPTIAPTGAIFHVTGTTPIATISLPYTGFVGTITIIPDGIFTTTTAGNIALASTMVVGKANSMTYDGAKWYPSY